MQGTCATSKGWICSVLLASLTIQKSEAIRTIEIKQSEKVEAFRQNQTNEGGAASLKNLRTRPRGSGGPRGSQRGSTRGGSTRGGGDEFDGNNQVREYQCPPDSVGRSYRLLPITDDRWYWFEQAFTPERGAKMGVGFDVKEKRDPYDAINLRGVWRVRGGDRKRFEGGVRKAWGQKCKGKSRAKCMGDTGWINSVLQRIKGIDKLIPTHPMGQKFQKTLSLFLHGTKPDIVPLVACNGMRASAKGLFGAAIYLSDRIAKIDQYVGDDCEGWGSCSYLLDNAQTVDGRTGFPPDGAEYDRNKPVHYAFVLLTSPLRIANEFPLRKRGGRGRKDEVNLFKQRGGKWVNWPFNFTTQSFDMPGRGGRALFDNFEFAHAYSRVEHEKVFKKVKRNGWNPILDRYDEFYMRDNEYLTAEYLVAYQRDCQYTC